ncbi:MAG: AAA family ATPase [Methylococcaceae bacterium]
MLKTIKLTNLLSFGATTEISFNKGLNVLIGANGSGKSNLIEAISLLQAMPKDLTKAVRDGGGIEEWLWKGEENPIAQIEAVIQNTKGQQALRHTLKFRATNYRIEVINELIENETMYKGAGYKQNYFYYRYDGKQATVNERVESRRELHWENIETDQSILAQRQDPDAYPEMSYLSSNYQKIRLYREWQFGRYTPSRKPQRADLPNDFLEENIINLALILNSLRQNRDAKKKLLEALKLFYEDIEDFDLRVHSGYVEIFFQESNFNSPIPATRLSDGTLRYLSLLAILLHPNPPPLICIEEPELGLHPDILPTLCDLLKEASQKTQVIITTHSPDLIDDLTDMPEAVLVFDKYKGSTTVKSLKQNDLIEWLADYKDYKLGKLWRSGEFGGNRW